MKIESFERVIYENNPLAEVICQIQFGRIDDLSDVEKTVLKEEFTTVGYSAFSEEVSLVFTQEIIFNSTQSPTPESVAFPQVSLHHFSTEDGVWRVTISSEFVALACSKYSGWDEFLPRMLEAVRILTALRSDTRPTRLGLRYKDVIEREPLGLDGVPWHELIEPFLLGPLAPNALAEGQMPSEAEVDSFLSQTRLRLDHSMLLLQSSLLSSLDGQLRAFLIDTDFYNEGDLESGLLSTPEVLSTRLDTLHASAGALFRRGIKKRLHDALHPSN
jgi:uncharacterized protein (TIGR04255 family)